VSTAYLVPGNTEPLKEIWAWVSVDKNGNEGIMGGPIPGLSPFAQFVFGTRERAERMRPLVEQTSRDTGLNVKLVRFARET
jgi:hypothetical protein